MHDAGYIDGGVCNYLVFHVFFISPRVYACPVLNIKLNPIFLEALYIFFWGGKSVHAQNKKRSSQ